MSAEEDVVFTQASLSPNTYRDAVQFVNGAVVRLQDLIEGQRAQVLSLEITNDEVDTSGAAHEFVDEDGALLIH